MQQLTLWAEEQQEAQQVHTVPVRWADGDTSEVALHRLLAIVEAQRAHYLCGYQSYGRSRLVFFYMKIDQIWVEESTIYARGVVTPEGSYVRECQQGIEGEVDDDEDY